jgi:hypothetical protein
MHKATHSEAKFRAEKKAMGFNMNKLQAVICLSVSMIISIGLISLGFKAFN